MNTKTHDLKCWPVYFEPLHAGLKTFEIRRNDRDYQVGDRLIVREWCPTAEAYTTGRHRRFEITYILDDTEYLQPGYVALGLAPLPPLENEP